MRASGLAMLLATVLAASAVSARTVQVLPGALAGAVRAAGEGDTLLLARGTHAGPVEVATPRLVVRGQPGTRIVSAHRGSVVIVTGAGAVLEDLELAGSGDDVMHLDAGVRIINAGGVRLERLAIHDVLYGVAVDRGNGLVVRNCTLAGRVEPRPDAVDEGMDGNSAGNGLHLWSTPDAMLAGNRAHNFQDAIYLSFCDRTRVLDDTLETNGRYGFHTMYCQGTQIHGSVFRHDVAGCAIMFSNHLDVRGNHFEHNRGSRTYGLLLRDCSDGTFADNSLVDDTIALFMDNSNRNLLAGNLVQDDGWGVLLYSSCAGNVFTGNSFVNCDYPVALDMKYTDNQFDDGRTGNYWSENAAYDLDANGVSDVPYSPVSAFAFVSKQYPDLTVLAKSPAVAALGVAERVFPALRPSEAVDRFPLVAPPRRGAAARETGRRAPVTRPFAVAGFAGLLAAGALGIARRERRPMSRPAKSSSR